MKLIATMGLYVIGALSAPARRAMRPNTFDVSDFQAGTKPQAGQYVTFNVLYSSHRTWPEYATATCTAYPDAQTSFPEITTKTACSDDGFTSFNLTALGDGRFALGIRGVLEVDVLEADGVHVIEAGDVKTTEPEDGQTEPFEYYGGAVNFTVPYDLHML